MVTDKKFTKGIWSIGASWNLCVISESIGHVIAECSVESYMAEEEMRANAKLIAAAPELFEAIETMIRLKDIYLPSGCDNIKEEHRDEMVALLRGFRQMEEAIKKATE